MNKIRVTLFLSSLVFLLGACGMNAKKASKESKEETSITTNTNQQSSEGSTNNSMNEKEKSIFTGTLVEDAKRNDTTDQSIRLVLNQVMAIEDPAKLIAMMKNDGVILNVLDSQLSEELSENELKAGDKIQFTLTGVPATTMSIPPQIVGNAVELVEKK